VQALTAELAALSEAQKTLVPAARHAEVVQARDELEAQYNKAQAKLREKDQMAAELRSLRAAAKARSAAAEELQSLKTQLQAQSSLEGQLSALQQQLSEQEHRSALELQRSASELQALKAQLAVQQQLPAELEAVKVKLQNTQIHVGASERAVTALRAKLTEAESRAAAADASAAALKVCVCMYTQRLCFELHFYVRVSNATELHIVAQQVEALYQTIRRTVHAHITAASVLRLNNMCIFSSHCYYCCYCDYCAG
jgi:DNA repair exonuclease SbcCD ATPase subunit